MYDHMKSIILVTATMHEVTAKNDLLTDIIIVLNPGPVTGLVATTDPVPAVACDWLMQSRESQRPEPVILFTYSLGLYAKTT